MRQIKFRGFSLDREGWLYGDLAHRTYHNEDGTDEVWTYINSIDRNEEVRRQKNNIFNTAINPNTIGQFTGLYDRNGKEIYEGDILIYIDMDANEHYREVVYHNGCFRLHNPYAKLPDAPIHYHLINGELNWEIFGNIHEQSKI